MTERRPPHRSDVQGLRAVAVLMVVLYHAGLPLPGGFVGVDVFFVVSGMVIGRLLLDEVADTGRLALGTFYARRARRILPLLALVVVAVLVVQVLTANPFDPEAVVFRTGLTSSVMVGNLYLYRHTGYFDGRADDANPLLHLWSLSVEEQFYAVLPLVVLAGAALARRRGWSSPQRAVVVVVGVGCGVSLALAVALVSGWSPLGLQAPIRFAFFSPVTRWWELATGVLLAAGAGPLSRLSAGAGRVLVAAGAGLLVVAATTTDPVRFPGLAALPAVVGAAALLAGAPRAPGVDRVLGAAPLRWVGDRSYGWYLWHWPAIVVTARLRPDDRGAVVVAAVGALGLAAITHPLVEERFRHDVGLVGRRALALGAACIVLMAAVAVAGASGRDHGWGLDEPGDWYEASPGFTDGCLIINRDLVDDWDEDLCTHGDAGGRGTVLVVGDSGVANAVPGLRMAAAQRGLATAEWARAGCPFSGRPVEGYPLCAEWIDDVWALVDRLDPVAVVIADRALEETVRRPLFGDAPRLQGEGSRTERWRSGLTVALERLADRGVPAIVVGPVPDHGLRFPRAELSVLDPHPAAPVLDMAAVEQERSPVVAATSAAVAAVPGSVYLDPLSALCPDGACPTRVDGRWWYVDGHHLTQIGSRQLEAAMGHGLETVLGSG